MLIKTGPSASVIRRPQVSNNSVTLADEAPPKDTNDTLKSVINGAAYTTGGALGGLALGAVSGKVMGVLTANDVFTTYGGAVGALGGAATSLAISMSNEPVSLPRTFGSWTGSAVGATGGMYLMKTFGNFLAANGAAGYLGTHGALIGAVAGGLTGVGVGFLGDQSKFGIAAKATANSAALAGIGVAAGGAAQALLSNTPVGFVTGSIPLVAGLAGAMVGVNNQINPGWSGEYGFKANSVAIDTATKSVLGGSLGYAAGFVAGGFAHAAGGSAAYAIAGPALGAAVGAGLAFGEMIDSKNVGLASAAAGSAGAGTLAGNLVGYGVSVVTGQGIFSGLGALAGAVTAGSMYLDSNGKAGRYAFPVAAGVSGGTAVGALLGAGLTALTGHGIYQNVGTAVGAAAGAFSGLAFGINRKDYTKGW